MNTTGTPRPAATLILVRSSAQGPEVLLMKRGASARFMPNAYVFAGGAVDPRDTVAEVYSLSPNLDDQESSSLLALPAQGLGFYVAAVRETFEECGLLLARQEGELVNLSSWSDAQLHQARTDLACGNTGLVELCRRHGWQLALEELHYFAHWVTPVGMPQRFDTRFFIARAPVNQRASLASDEMSELIWRAPRAALCDHAAGRILLMKATRAMLEEIAMFDSIGSLLQSARTPRKIAVVRPTRGEAVPQPVPISIECYAPAAGDSS